MHGLRPAGSRIAKRPRQRRWGSRFSLALRNAEGEGLTLARQGKWWGPVVLEAAGVPVPFVEDLREEKQDCRRLDASGNPSGPTGR
jgi:hypothetical protein